MPRSAFFRSFSTRAFAFLLAGTTLLAACGGDDNNGPSDSNPEPEPSQEGTFFAMENYSSHDAYYVYIRACGTSDWGSDMLGSSILDVNERITWTVNNPGCFDVRARTSNQVDPVMEAVWEDVQVAANQTTTLELDDENWQAVQ
jgi:hypothetical protein